MRKPLQFLTPFALASGLTLPSVPAHATFIIDLSCGEAHCAGGTDFKNDSANHDVSTFTGTVGGHARRLIPLTQVPLYVVSEAGRA